MMGWGGVLGERFDFRMGIFARRNGKRHPNTAGRDEMTGRIPLHNDNERAWSCSMASSQV